MGIQMEQTGSTLFQTLAGLLLDSNRSSGNIINTAFQYLLNAFLSLNILQCVTISVLAYLQHRKDLLRKRSLARRPSSLSIDTHLPTASSIHRLSISSAEETPLLRGSNNPSYQTTNDDTTTTTTRSGHHGRMQGEICRGQIMAVFCALLVFSAWFLFMVTAWYKLGQKNKNL